MADLSYDLKRTSGEGLEGEYSGRWEALPQKIAFDEDSGLFLAKFDLSVRGIGNDAQMSLTRIL